MVVLVLANDISYLGGDSQVGVVDDAKQMWLGNYCLGFRGNLRMIRQQLDEAVCADEYALELVITLHIQPCWPFSTSIFEVYVP